MIALVILIVGILIVVIPVVWPFCLLFDFK
jgi:hypothetical protein